MFRPWSPDGLGWRPAADRALSADFSVLDLPACLFRKRDFGISLPLPDARCWAKATSVVQVLLKFPASRPYDKYSTWKQSIERLSWKPLNLNSAFQRTVSFLRCHCAAATSRASSRARHSSSISGCNLEHLMRASSMPFPKAAGASWLWRDVRPVPGQASVSC